MCVQYNYNIRLNFSSQHHQLPVTGNNPSKHHIESVSQLLASVIVIKFVKFRASSVSTISFQQIYNLIGHTFFYENYPGAKHRAGT